MNASTSIITFPPVDPSSLDNISFRAYCLSPPDDSCDFGPCPNTDITGIGQQISLYVTSTSLALIILYASHKQSRLSTYAHFANIYALVISAYISLGRGQLTQSDAVFVLAVVASPVSIYFWLLHIAQLRKLGKIRALKDCQDFLPTLMIFCSFVLWITMAGLTLRPHASLPFSQRACRTVQLHTTWVSLLWYFLYIAQNGLLVLCCSTAPACMPREWKDRRSDMDIVHWTRVMLERGLMPMTNHRVAAILFTIQISAVASIPGELFQWASVTLLSGFALVLIFWVSKPSSPPSIPETLGLIIFSGTILMTSVSDLLPTMPRSPLTVICILLHLRSSHLRSLHLHLPTKATLLSYFYFMFALIVSSTPFILSLTPYRHILGTTPLFIQYILWIGPWVTTRELKRFSPIAYAQLLWNDVLQRAPLLKFNHLIVIPHFAWVWATIAANPTPTYDLTFGQLLALFLLFIPLWAVIKLVYKRRKAVKHALWMTEMDDGLPMTGISDSTPPTSDSAPSDLKNNVATGPAPTDATMILVPPNPNEDIKQVHPPTFREARRKVNTIG